MRMQQPFGRIFLLIQLALFFIALGQPGMVTAKTNSFVPQEEMIADSEARLMLARFLALEEGRLGEAAEEYRILLREAQQDVTVLRELADVLVRLGKPNEAMGHLEAALKIAPEDIELRLSMAGLETAMGHVAQAQRLTADICGSPKIATANLSCVGLLLSWGEFYQAEAVVRRHLATHPEDTAGRRMLADILVGSQRFPGAEGVIRLLLLDEPASPDLYVRLATIKILAKDFNGALMSARASSELMN